MIQSDGYYIGTRQQCEAYNEFVKEGENYRGVTTRWADVRQHPSRNEFAITKHKSYDDETMQYVAELPDDWNPEIDIID